MLNGKSILITGGTGDFGEHFVKYILKHYSPKRVIIFSRNEQKQCLMKERYREKEEVLRFFIGDVRDKDRLSRALTGVDYVVHASALKKTEVCEYNPIEAIKTNIEGAVNVIDASINAGVKKIVSLSTGEAVNPISIYGGTKLVSDKLFIYGNSYSGENGTRFSVVRCGNVISRKNDYISAFENCKKFGKNELPIKDYRMTRFWIENEQVLKQVLFALEYSQGGEVFVPKAPSFRITDMAEAIVPGISKIEIGLDEGEVISESLITAEYSRRTYDYGSSYIVYPKTHWWKESMIIPGGIKVEEDFIYNSAVNEEWIGVNGLRERLKKLGVKLAGAL